MCFMCFCQLPFRTEASGQQNILAWASFFNSSFLMEKKSLTFFLYNTTSPNIYKVKLHAGNILFIFRFCSGH